MFCGQINGTRLRDAHNAKVSLAGFLDLVLPSVCPLCTVAEGPGLCTACREELPELIRPCPWCGMPRPAGHHDDRCYHCSDGGLPHLATVTVRWAYADSFIRLIGHAKAAGRPAAVRVCAGLMPVLDIEGPAAIIPVPPSPGRRPGPHLGTALARAVSRQTGQPCVLALATTRRAHEQHRLTAGQRTRNVEGLFVATRPVPAYVVLIDDLLTSGATASAAARALRQAGAKRVELVALARTLKGA